ncbi:MAG: helix-turn-helix domain-containing protein [Acidimicrobiales bacterium]|nr:helix-turn-helix domain-containing protein [Acidimicrobiales bacterium]
MNGARHETTPPYHHSSTRRPAAPSLVRKVEEPPLGTAPRAEEGNQKERASSTNDRLVLTVDEVAYLLNISRGLAYELVARGELPAIRLGRRIVIPRVAMEELLGTPIH